MRQRQVFPTSEIPHKWAHATQPEARNAQGNLYFRGDTIFSYRNSWPLGRIYRKRGADPFVLLNSSKYSNTTAKHQYAVNRACSHLASVSVPYVVPTWSLAKGTAPDHSQNLAYLAETAATRLKKAQRAMQTSVVRYYRDNATAALREWNTYATFFGIRRKAPDPQVAAWDAATARVQRIEQPDPVRDAKRFKARERRQIAAQAALQVEFNAHCAAIETYNAAVRATQAAAPDCAQVWRDTGKWPRLEVNVEYPYASYKMERKFRRAGFAIPARAGMQQDRENCLLRVNGDQIETSQGARIPVAHAERLWRVILAARAGHPYQSNGHSEHAGEFKVQSVDVNGTLIAGCHTILWPELERMAKSLGLSGAHCVTFKG